MIAIALDGPAGAGKSSLSKALAEKYSLIHVDTGAIYRGVGYYFTSNGLDYNNPATVVAQLGKITLSLIFSDNGQKMMLNGTDITDYIRTTEVSKATSAVSAVPEVREFLLEQQRSIARNNNVIMDGRDIGTVVLPDATAKIFLTASVDARAKRRYNELLEAKEDVTLEDVRRDMEKRDFDDSTRSAAPLKMADDAILLDTSEISFRQSMVELAKIIDEKLAVTSSGG